MQDVKPDIVAGTAACEEVKCSKKFARILELILLLGNYMNSGSKNGQAFGFEISFLTKVSNRYKLLGFANYQFTISMQFMHIHWYYCFIVDQHERRREQANTYALLGRHDRTKISRVS